MPWGFSRRSRGGGGSVGRTGARVSRERAGDAYKREGAVVGVVGREEVSDAVAFFARNGREETASNEKGELRLLFSVACWAGLASTWAVEVEQATVSKRWRG